MISSNTKENFKVFRAFVFELFGSDKYSKPSLNKLDEKLARYLNFKEGFFIEAGANNGYSQSNTYYLEKFMNWKGILVEGIPELYVKCKKNRKKSLVYNCALVSGEFQDEYVEMQYADLMSMVKGSMKSCEAQVAQLERGISIQKINHSYSIKVPAKTLESILDGFEDLPKIDFMSLDVEGYELDVLKGLNLEKYRPSFLLVEARFFTEVNNLLCEYYEMIEKLSNHDYLYKLKQLNTIN